ncbi:hypothetical protein RJ639_044718 [Escallonia herrerae]|uniref:Disease resistance N-terminal domain-containing protein n=1 Tax=Escallonia herrerae TaxID=1293975 RepID=A0AA89B1K0_9ASTE|nr:hypothetical protein RJ639_044718 [Escallonia herrerae]
MALVGVDLMNGKIVSILENEASLLGSVYDELDELKHELKSMRSCLEDADRKRVLTQGDKSWVEAVTDMCNAVEDIIEEFIYHMNKLEKGEEPRAFSSYTREAGSHDQEKASVEP